MNHQHIFNVRLDLDVDGMDNSVYEIDSDVLPMDETNPWGNAFASRSTLLETEAAAQRLIDPFKARCWKIVNPSRATPSTSRGDTGSCPARTRCPSTTPSPASASARDSRATTSGSRRSMRPSVTRPATTRYRTPAGGGLPEWTRSNRSIAEHGRGPLVHVRPPPHPAAGGLARDARGDDRLRPLAGRLLRSQSGARRSRAARCHPG